MLANGPARPVRDSVRCGARGNLLALNGLDVERRERLAKRMLRRPGSMPDRNRP
jgi:hypothetical protein